MNAWNLENATKYRWDVTHLFSLKSEFIPGFNLREATRKIYAVFVPFMGVGHYGFTLSLERDIVGTISVVDKALSQYDSLSLNYTKPVKDSEVDIHFLDSAVSDHAIIRGMIDGDIRGDFAQDCVSNLVFTYGKDWLKDHIPEHYLNLVELGCIKTQEDK